MTTARKLVSHLTAAPVRTSLACALLLGGLAFWATRLVMPSLFVMGTAGVAVFTILELSALIACSAADLRQRAASLDRTGANLVPLALSVAFLSLVASISQTPQANAGGVGGQFLVAAHFTLVTAAVWASWLFVQTAFAVRYAHIYCTEIDKTNSQAECKPLIFPGTEAPDGHDMLHFSIAIGASTVTADINIASKTIRRLTTLHSIYSYFFNACILALTINLTASALQN